MAEKKHDNCIIGIAHPTGLAAVLSGPAYGKTGGAAEGGSRDGSDGYGRGGRGPFRARFQHTLQWTARRDFRGVLVDFVHGRQVADRGRGPGQPTELPSVQRFLGFIGGRDKPPPQGFRARMRRKFVAQTYGSTKRRGKGWDDDPPVAAEPYMRQSPNPTLGGF